MSPSTGGAFGSSQWGRTRWAGTAAPIGAVDPIVTPQYRMELLDIKGALIARLPNWTSALADWETNRPDTLKFTYPFTDEATASITGLRQIRLYDRTNRAISLVRIVKRTPMRNQNGQLELMVECRGLLSQLGSEWVDSYTATNATVKSIVSDLLGFQKTTAFTRISRGKVSAAIGNQTATVTITNQTILDALLKLQQNIGGMMYVPDTPVFKWVQETGTNEGTHITLNKNLQSLKVVEDYENIYTRVVIYGQGATPATRIKVTANDTSGPQGSAVIQYTMSMPEETDTDRMQLIANEEVRKRAQVRKHVTCDIIDLENIQQRLDYSHEGFFISKRVIVYDSLLNETLTTRISKITRDLAVPAGIKIQVQDPQDFGTNIARIAPQRTIIKPIVDMIEKVKQLTERDTGLLDLPKLLDGLGIQDLLELLHWVSGGAENLSPALADILNITNVSEICHWNETANTGNLDDKVKDVYDSETAAGGGIVARATATDLVTDPTARGTLNAGLETGATVADAILKDIKDGDGGSLSTAARSDHQHQLSDGYPHRFSDAEEPTADNTLDLWADSDNDDAPHIRVNDVWRSFLPILSSTEPDAADWQQGQMWVDTGTSHGAYFQVWLKTKESASSNASKVPIALFE